MRRFDDAAIYCRDYFGQQGYTSLASLLSGNGGNGEPVLGAAFCENMGSKALETATATSTRAVDGYQTDSRGLALWGPTTDVGACETVRVLRSVTYGESSRDFGARIFVLLVEFLVCVVFS